MRDALNRLVAAEVAEIKYGSAWTGEDISRFEAKSGLKLPDRLASFLKRFGKVFFESPLFDVTFPSGATLPLELDSIGFTPERMLHWTTLYQERTEGSEVVEPARLPPGFIVVGQAEGKRSLLLMDGVNRDNSAVLLWGIAFDAFGEGNNTLGLGRVADDLAEWLRALSENPYRQ